MTRPALALVLLSLTVPAAAQDDERFVPAPLPAAFSAKQPHTPQPFPGEDDLQFDKGGTNGWAIGAGLFAGSAAVAGLVALGTHARSKSSDVSGSDRAQLEQVRNGSGIAALGLLGASGVCLVVSVAR